MKKIYWRPRSISRTALSLIALVSVSGLALVEQFPTVSQAPYYREKVQAVRRAQEAMDLIKARRIALGHPIDPQVDPLQTGLIGESFTPVTSMFGSLSAKQASVNPHFAAAIVEMLLRAGVGPRDVVAVGCSGSFPALNVCIYAALETLQARPIVITSASASQWGANLPDLMWLDMERLLYEHDLTSIRSVAASVGGEEDRGLGMSDEARQQIIAAIQRNGIPLLESASFEQAVQQRMDLFREASGGAPIAAYINVGGGTVSVGRSTGKRMFRPGLNLRAPEGVRRIDGVMPRFSRQRVPIVHLVEVRELAEHFGLFEGAPADASLYQRQEYNGYLAGGVLVGILASLYGFIRSDVGFRLLQSSRRNREDSQLEPML